MRIPKLTAAVVATLMLSPAHLPLVSAQSTASNRINVVPAQFPSGRAVPRDRVNQVYSQGYQSGIRQGERDARSRRARDYRRHNDYRRAGGWNNSRSGEADAFRRGFAQGYIAGFDRANRGGWGVPAYPSHPGPGYPSRGYPGPGFPGGGGYGYYSPAMDRGLEDGYRDGVNAARRNQRYDPVRERRYRSGDAGYNSRFGSREQYRAEYRNAYRQGYDRGFQEGRWRW